MSKTYNFWSPSTRPLDFLCLVRRFELQCLIMFWDSESSHLVLLQVYVYLRILLMMCIYVLGLFSFRMNASALATLQYIDISNSNLIVGLIWYQAGACGSRQDSAVYFGRMSRSLCNLDKHGIYQHSYIIKFLSFFLRLLLICLVYVE